MTIFKELKELSDKLKSEGHPNYHNEARRLINVKYGKDWRDKNRIRSINNSDKDFNISYY